MKKRIIIDLDGVVFEPVDDNFATVAVSQYGPIKGRAVNMAYKYKIGRRIFARDIARVLNECAANPTVRSGALDALEKIASMPGVTIEFCSQIAFPGQAYALEQQYRAMAPCMDAATHYELMSPFVSKREYLRELTATDKDAMNYIVDTRMKNLDWPARWRIIPVLIENRKGESIGGNHIHGARVFNNLEEFRSFLKYRSR